MKQYLKRVMLKKKRETKVSERKKEEPIMTIKHACPLCSSDIKGNDSIMYYCRHCNILFRKKDLKTLL